MASERDTRVAGEALLIGSLTDRYAIAKAILALDKVALASAARIVRADAPIELARSDPARYRALRTAITNYRIRGYDAVVKLKN